jgi:hypothetical protein
MGKTRSNTIITAPDIRLMERGKPAIARTIAPAKQRAAVMALDGSDSSPSMGVRTSKLGSRESRRR